MKYFCLMQRCFASSWTGSQRFQLSGRGRGARDKKHQRQRAPGWLSDLKSHTMVERGKKRQEERNSHLLSLDSRLLFTTLLIDMNKWKQVKPLCVALTLSLSLFLSHSFDLSHFSFSFPPYKALSDTVEIKFTFSTNRANEMTTVTSQVAFLFFAVSSSLFLPLLLLLFLFAFLLTARCTLFPATKWLRVCTRKRTRNTNKRIYRSNCILVHR